MITGRSPGYIAGTSDVYLWLMPEYPRQRGSGGACKGGFMANFNIKRLSEDIKRELSAAVSGVKDPRVSKNFVTVTHCELTSDLSYCRVHIACLGGEDKTAKAVEGMTAASGYFKKAIAARVRMRKMPELIFLPDNSLDYSAHIEDIISKLPKPVQEEQPDSEEASDEKDRP